MLSFTILSVGRLKDQFYQDAAAEYLKRLTPYAKTAVIEIRAAELPPEPNAAQIAAALEREEREILKRLPAGSLAVALCVEGKPLSSEGFSAWIDRAAGAGNSHIVFVIGGSYGLSEAVKSRAALRLSMSDMTFPHRLARVMLLEQLYRAEKILAGERYHK